MEAKPLKIQKPTLEEDLMILKCPRHPRKRKQHHLELFFQGILPSASLSTTRPDYQIRTTIPIIRRMSRRLRTGTHSIVQT